MTEPLFLPTEAGASDVLRRARRRRRRQAALAAAVVAAAAVTSSLLALPGVGRGADRISVVPTSPGPTATTTSTPHAAGSAHPAVPSLGSGRPAAGARSGSPSAGVPVGPQPPTNSPTPTAPARRHSAAAPISRTTVAFTSQCDATNDLAGWCELYSGPASAHRKHPVSLSMELCRLPVAGDGQVSFDDTREVDLIVESSAGAQQWRAGQGVKNSAHPHTVTVRGGTCLRWAATWDTIAGDGFYAPPGSYVIGYGLDSSQMSQFTSANALELTD